MDQTISGITNGRDTRAIHKLYAWRIQVWRTRPPIPNEKPFKLKGQFLHLLKEIPFTGKENEDAYQHVEEIIKITDSFHTHGVSKDVVMLRVFPTTLPCATKHRLRAEPSESKAIWYQLKTIIKRFSLPLKIAKMKANIQNIEKLEDETLYDVWDCYKEML